MDDLGQIIARIKFLHRDRCFAMNVRKILNLKVGSRLRIQLGWQRDKPEAERKRIAAQAKRLMNEPDSEDNAVIGTRAAREPFEAMEAGAKKAMAALAKQLPVWDVFGKGVRGFGEVSLAVIVAEAGDLSNYASKAKLWKRMGLAPGQNRVPPGLSREDRKQAWIKNKYSPPRRSRMWNVGETLFKAQVRIIKDADGKDMGERIAIGKYGEVYLRRKLHTQQTHPEWWHDKDGNEKIDKKTGRQISDHGHNDAQRYMEKRLLYDLWRAWRPATDGVAGKAPPKVAAPPSPPAKGT